MTYSILGYKIHGCWGYGKGVYYYSLRGVMPHDDANDGLVSKKHG